MKTVTIIRGLPGSGKSTFANLIADEVFEADQFFYKDEKCEYDREKIKEAHDDCFARFKKSVEKGCDHIAIANTFTRNWEFRQYKEFAEENGYRVFVIIMENRHTEKDIHNVPADKIKNMKDRFEINL